MCLFYSIGVLLFSTYSKILKKVSYFKILKKSCVDGITRTFKFKNKRD